MNNTKIDHILTDIGKIENYQMKYEDDFEDYNEYLEYHSLLLIMLNDLKIVSKPLKNRTFYPSQSGLDIINNGGWLKHLEQEKGKALTNSEKEKYDFLSKKWVYKTRLLPFILSAIAICFSILTLILNLNKQQQNQELKKDIDLLKKQIETMSKDLKPIKPNN
jgi:hypothetical protein